MSEATKTKPPSTQQQRAVLRSLNQAVVAELIGRPASWMRDNGHRFDRNADGTYDGFAAVRSSQDALPAPKIDDRELEPVLQLIDMLWPEADRHDLALAAVTAIEDRHGGAGLQAIGEALRDELAGRASRFPTRPARLPSRDAFIGDAVAKAHDDAAAEYERIAGSWDARENGKTVLTCETCDRYRWGRQWKQPPLPSGYAALSSKGACPECLKG